MVTLRIDDFDINLSPDFSLEFYSENPFFTRSGDYTYELTISLNDRINRIAFSHVNRITSSKITKTRQAYLYDGPKLLCCGKEVILEKNNDAVKIQIVSNNAELNYISKNANKIRTLDFGTIPTPTESYAVGIRNKYFPETNYCFPMLVKTNIYTIKSYDNFINCISDSPTETNYSMHSGTKLMPQPFILYYIEKIVELMGYTLGTNCLRNEARWLHFVVVHGYDTLEYAKMLPDWTVTEFIDNVERFFNVIFMLDSHSNTVNIENVKTFYNGKDTIEIEHNNVLKEFIRKFNDSNDSDSNVLYINYKNIKYAEQSTEYFKYANIDVELRKKCTTQTAKLGSFLATEELSKEYIIYNDNFWRFNYAPVYLVEGGISDSQNNYNQIDQFRPYIGGSEDDDYSELKIVPAEVYPMLFIGNGSRTMLNSVALPTFYEGQEKGMRDTIISGDNGDSASSIMQCAFFFFTNLQLSNEDGSGLNYGQVYGTNFTTKTYFGPWLITSRYLVSSSMFGIRTTKERFGNMSGINMELNGTDGKGINDYTNDIDVDTKNEFIFQIKTRSKIDVMSFILIGGRKFYIRKIKYQVEGCRMSQIVELTCYPVS